MRSLRSCLGLSAVLVLGLAGSLFLAAAEPTDKPPTPKQLEQIAKVKADFGSKDPAVRKEAVGSLVHSDISGYMLSVMQAGLLDPDGPVREVAATATGNLGAAAVPAVPQLIKQLKGDSMKEARETAARALGRIGKAAPEEKRGIEPLKTAAKEDSDPVTRTVALGALAMMGIDLADQVASLRTYLHDKEPLVRMKASHALGMIGLPAKAAAAEIVKVLETETDHHRLGYVARALGNVGDPASLPALYAALKKETDGGAQGEIRGAINKLCGKLP